MKKVIEFAKRVYGDHVEFNDAQTQRLQEIEALVRADERERIEHAAIGSVKAAILYEREACAKDRQDAARYRHMRNNAQFQSRNGPGLYWYLPRFSDGDEGQRLDDAIDAAIRARGNT